MIKIFVAAALLAGATTTFAQDAVAQDEAPVITGRSASCDAVVQVCAVMNDDRLVPYSSECRARADGAKRVLFGDCYDED